MYLHAIEPVYVPSMQGLKRFDARERVAQMLQKRDLWRGQVPHSMAVPVCSRSGDIIEPMLKDQWFLDMSSMASKAIEVIYQYCQYYINDTSTTIYLKIN